MKNSQKKVDQMIKVFQERRNFLVNELNKLKMLITKFQEELFMFFQKFLKNNNMNSSEISNYLLEKKFIATVPGSSFGSNGEGYLRISYANTMKILKYL